MSDIAKNCCVQGVHRAPWRTAVRCVCINVNGYADKFPRKEIDKLGEFVKTYRAKGLAWMKLAADGSDDLLVCQVPVRGRDCGH